MNAHRRMFKIDLARNWEACVMRWALAVFIGVVMGLLFYQLPVTFVGGVNFLGMIYQGLFFLQVSVGWKGAARACML